MAKNSVYSIATIKRLMLPVFQQYGIMKAVLFGSYAKGLATPKSDIDIIVSSDLTGFKFCAFADSLEDTVGKRVDVFDYTHINPNSNMEREIARTGVTLYER